MDLVSAQCSRYAGQEGFGISTMQQVCRTRWIWYQHNAAGVQDKGIWYQHNAAGVQDKGGLVWYKRFYVSALYVVNGITTVFITMQYLCMYCKLCNTNIYYMLVIYYIC